MCHKGQDQHNRWLTFLLHGKLKHFLHYYYYYYFLTLLWQIPAQTAFQGNLETASAAASFSHLCMLHLSGAICMEICLSSKSAFLS